MTVILTYAKTKKQKKVKNHHFSLSESLHIVPMHNFFHYANFNILFTAVQMECFYLGKFFSFSELIKTELSKYRVVII